MNFEQGMLLCCYGETALSSLARACFRSSSDILNVRMSVRLGHDWWWGGGGVGGGGSVGGAEGLRWAGAHLLHMPVVQTPQLDKWLQIDIRQMGRAGVSSFSLALALALALTLALALANYLLNDTLGGGTPHVAYRRNGLPRCPRRTLH